MSQWPPPINMGFLSSLHDISFPGGAVEFDPPSSVSFTEGGLPDHTKAIISVWFRIPQTTIDAMRALFNSDQGDSGPLAGIIPILTFGPDKKAQGIKSVDTSIVVGTNTVHEWFSCAWNVISVNPITSGTTAYFPDGKPFPYGPSFIGVNVTQKTNRLAIRLQTKSRAVYTGVVLQSGENGPGSIDSWGDPAPTCPDGNPNTEFFWVDSSGPFTRLSPPMAHYTSTALYTDVSALSFPKNEAFINLSPNINLVKDASSKVATITGDHWHHLFLSYDTSKPTHFSQAFAKTTDVFIDTQNPSRTDHTEVNTPATVSGGCQFAIALDDVNLVGPELRDTPRDVQFKGTPLKLGANNLMTESAWTMLSTLTVSGSSSANNTSTGTGQTNISAAPQQFIDFAGGRVDGAPFGIPVSSVRKDRGRTVEVAALQVYTGTALATDSVVNRRLFITAEGTPSSTAAKQLGKPKIKFRSVGAWQTGKNAGSGGKFKPTGNIPKYTPNPSLHGPQG